MGWEACRAVKEQNPRTVSSYSKANHHIPQTSGWGEVETLQLRGQVREQLESTLVSSFIVPDPRTAVQLKRLQSNSQKKFRKREN